MPTRSTVARRTTAGCRTATIAAALALAVAACGSDSDADATGSEAAPTTSAATATDWTVQQPPTDDDPSAFVVLERANDQVRLPRILVEHPSADDEAVACAADGVLRRDTARDDLVDVDLDSLTIEAYACFDAEALEAQLIDELTADGVDGERIDCVASTLDGAPSEEWATALVWDAEGVVFEPCGIDR